MVNEPSLTATLQRPAGTEVFIMTISEFEWTFASVIVTVLPLVKVLEANDLVRRYGL